MTIDKRIKFPCEGLVLDLKSSYSENFYDLYFLIENEENALKLQERYKNNRIIFGIINVPDYSDDFDDVDDDYEYTEV